MVASRSSAVPSCFSIGLGCQSVSKTLAAVARSFQARRRPGLPRSPSIRPGRTWSPSTLSSPCHSSLSWAIFTLIMSSPAWDIYSNALEPLQYGFPLWCPEPSPEFGEVRLGDVGYIDRGCFCFLFNTTRAAEDAVNRRGVPHGFVRLTDQPERFTRSPERTMQTVLCSEGVQSMTGTVPQSTATPVDGSRCATNIDHEMCCPDS